MSSAAREALKLGMNHLRSGCVLGQVFRCGGVTFNGLTGLPTTSDRGTPGGFSQGLEYDIEVEASADCFRGGIPKSGKSLVRDGISYPIVGVRHSIGGEKVVFLCKQPFTE